MLVPKLAHKWFLFAFHDVGTGLDFVSVLDFFLWEFCLFLNTGDGQTGIETIFGHYRNTHARYFPGMKQKKCLKGLRREFIQCVERIPSGPPIMLFL